MATIKEMGGGPHCCWPAGLYYNQLEEYVSSLSDKELRAALKEFRACGEGWSGPSSITYYPTIEVTFEGEDVYPAMRAELRRRRKRPSGKEVQ